MTSASAAASSGSARTWTDFPASSELPRHESVTPVRVVGSPLANPTPATLKLYAGEWARFVDWCRQHSRPPLPASADTLAAYLLVAAPGLNRGTLGRCRAAISTTHRQAGRPIPLLNAEARKALRAAAKPKAATQPGPATDPVSLARAAAKCSRDLRGLRDRALLLLVAATTQPPRRRALGIGGPGNAGEAAPMPAVPRLFLLTVNAEDIRFTPSGVELQLRVRTDEAVPSRLVRLTCAAAAATCPVRALEDWLRSSGTTFGPVFRKVDRWGNVEHERLGTDACYSILARRLGTSPRRPSKPEDR